MKKILLVLCVVAFSCTQKADAGKSDNDAVYLASYTGKYYAPDHISGWAESFSPNFSATLILYTNLTCELNAGIMEWPYKTECDNLKLRYKATASGLDLFDADHSEPVLTVTSKEINPENDPGQDLVNYLGYQLDLHLQKSLGKVWDAYSGLADWPNNITLTWQDSNVDDVL